MKGGLCLVFMGFSGFACSWLLFASGEPHAEFQQDSRSCCPFLLWVLSIHAVLLGPRYNQNSKNRIRP